MFAHGLKFPLKNTRLVPSIESSDEALSGSNDKGIAPGETKVVEVKENANSGDLPISNYTPTEKKESKPYDGYMKVRQPHLKA